MLVIPAIDLLDGACVRLYQGDYANSTVYGSDPVEMAVRLKAAGAERIHIVDLNAARRDGENNRRSIVRVRKAVDIAIETGGGIRTENDVTELLDIGIDFLVIGTALALDPDTTGKWIRRYGRRFLAGIDALDGKVKISGWKETIDLTDLELSRKAAALGFSEIIYTNVARDGTLTGPDLERSVMVSEASGLPVIVAGGIRNEEDFAEAKKLEHRGISGVITGKALYEGKIDLKRLTAIYRGGGQPGADSG